MSCGGGSTPTAPRPARSERSEDLQLEQLYRQALDELYSATV